MKKYLSILIIVFVSILLFGCSDPKYISYEKKPHKAYYTEALYSIVKSDEFDYSILDTNLYKDATVSKEDSSIFKNTIKSLSPSNFIDKPQNLADKPIYKLFIKNSSKKFVINVYENNIVSVFPWDGNFPEDFIDLTSIPEAYKLKQFCEYIYQR